MHIRSVLAGALLWAARAQTVNPPPAEETTQAAQEEGVYKDITDERATIWDKIEGLFGNSRKYVYMDLKRGTNFGLLPNFCLDEDLWSDDTVVSCECCVDHLIGDSLGQSALMYKGKKEEAPAFQRYNDGSTRQVGMVNVWSLGGRIPAVLCDRGRLVCHCEDPVRGWAEFEPACRRGHPCEPPEEVVEGVSVGYDEKVDSVAEESKSKGASAMEMNSTMEGTALASCGIGRIPLGTAFCEDFSVEQCDTAYSRTKKGIHHFCVVDKKTFRHCGGTLMSEEDAQKRTEEAQAWAIQNFYTPDLDWKVMTANFTTRVVDDPLPPAKVFDAYVQQRMDEQNTLEKLNE
mmetsp:Transcript_41042/g.76332  ORF Transcript_41042/g.76332 Transcript_41042/m.76332 type:complete len:346 (-) Transcript_41042:61-1098(-)